MKWMLRFSSMQISSAILGAILMQSINLISIFSIFLIVVTTVVDVSDTISMRKAFSERLDPNES